ncbi:putative Ubiquitin carboxyl-terminal hydrolase 13 [Cocos nucifera]|uniref:ubiquitinyl hydrolase 1 n=1 Tax=Cocos nucifera TaxID=13894 RepID=A0A8K0IGF7_COCNU|nr:putative Ubiquitin carboxyl-terminal hydrolase 13 [Cocos nucifera]
MTMMTPPPLDQEDDEMLVPHPEFAGGPQPMEVAPTETATTAENQQVEDPPSSRFTWTIENFSRLNTKKHYSDIFIVGGYKWRVLIFPKGNNVDHLSMYLDVADSATLPYGWSRYAQFSLAMINQIHNKYTIRKDTHHQFNARESDWGFTSFMPLSELYDPTRGYLMNDALVVEAEVAVRKVVDYWTYDSKKETGYVGLKNQGATCYMNSLLQTLYHIPYFRKAVYHMPTTENDMPSGSIPLALQSLFYKLQYSDSSVATKELTKSFGWDTYDSFMQHDVQELNRVLCEKLEDKMKGTVVEGTIQQLFEGHHMNYIECINVDYKSSRKESFYDLQLDVKGCRDVYASFDKYVEVERLEGDNKYHAEQYGLQQEDDEMLVPHPEFAGGPQPMEVAPTETATTAENQQVEDPPSSRFTWTIENFSRLNTKKHYSDIFIVGGYKWRVLIFPKGNNVDHLSMYLDVADSATLPYGWSRYAQFSLAMINQIHNKYTIRKDTHHQFNARESDWGFTSFMPLSELYDPTRGYLMNDALVVEAEVAVRKVVDYWTYDSKKETGYVGLKNQGATCYMNSLLQTLYHIPYFRKAVYHMPTTENDMPSGSIPLALQSLFYKLQYSDSSVATKELTKSFGWDTYDSFMQHDVQELNRVLCEKLEDKMKGTVVEGTIQQLFEGHHMNYIECINVDYKSSRKESFYDLQLDVKGCRDVYASFDKYVEVERLEGDNKYHAEQYGLQDAKKGALFIDFPPVLQLQLKRFEYDFMRDTMVKINDRYEFPLQLDLDRDNGKYLSPEADRGVRNLYTLHRFKFDDERVTKEDMKRALEEQYGGEEELPQTNPGFNNTPFKFTKYSNAYMLVYIRESDREKIICNVDEKDIAEHLRIRLKKEQEEKEHKKKEKAEAHLYTIIKVARDEDLAEQIGRDIYFDLVDHDKVRSFRIQKQLPFNAFKEEVVKEFGIPVQFQRFWLWAKRQNHTYRPNRPLSPQEEAQSVGQLREVSNKAHNAELKLFLEVELGLDLHPLPPPDKSKEDILLFFKLYDPEKEQLRYVGRLFVKALGKPSEILTKLNELAGYSPNEEIELYEEIKFEPSVMCEHIDKKLTFRSSQLEDGDIICYQKSPAVESDDQFRYPDVPSFLEYVRNRQVVHFRSLEKPKEDDFCLELSKLHTYDDVVERVAHHLGLNDPSKIRLTSHNCYSQQPKPQPIKYRGVEHLSDMLVHYNQTSDILYYEVLDIPLPELQGLKTLKVAFHHATKDEVVIHSIRLPKNSTVSDVINDLKTKVELSHPNAELRLLEVFYHKIYKIFPPNEKIENINDQYWTLRAEEIPEEEKNLGLHDRLIHVYHFTKDTSQNQVQVQNFGEPFFLVIHEGETLAEVKVRIQRKLQVPDEEFSKVTSSLF